MATEKAKKKAKLRHAEYYDFQKVQDKLFMDSANGKTFKHLVEIIAMPENIRLAYRNLKRNSGSKTPGTDGKTILALARLTDEELITKVQNKLKWYVPQSVRRVEIPKGNDSSKTRPLGIPTIMDRLIQQCVLQVLEPICEAKFHDHSYGFRPNRSQEHAIAQVHKDMQRSHLHYVVDVDIKGFFDNVNHGKLLKQMWTMGIRDKKLISIISTMLKAEVAGVGFPEKGTPQGGIISPLLSNIVLNELDWWLASQWEEMPTVYPYKGTVNPNGSVSRSHKFEALRRSNLKVVTSVRFADDFKIFTNSYSNAQKLYYATRDWLKERLSLDISPEKSKVINLRERYSEFLGFKIKLIPRGKNKDGSTRYVVKSHIRDKSIAQMKPKLKQLIYEIEHPKSTGKEVYRAVSRYNAYVSGLHNYYRLATKVCDDLSPFAISVHKSLKARLKERVKTAKQVRKYKIPCTTPLYIKEKYGKSMQMRYVEGHALIPIGYISHTPPKSMNRAINSYTREGRTAIHKSLDTIRSREISASIILQSKSQLKAIYKDNADTIEGNCDTTLFLGGKEKTTLKEMSEILGKETIDLYNTSDTRGNSPSYGLNYQKTGKEDMERIEELIRKAEHKEAYPFGFDVKQFKTDFATLMAVLEEASAKTEEEPVIEEVVTEETKTVSFKDVLKDIFEGLFSKITDPKVQEMLLKQIRALV